LRLPAYPKNQKPPFENPETPAAIGRIAAIAGGGSNWRFRPVAACRYSEKLTVKLLEADVRATFTLECWHPTHRCARQSLPSHSLQRPRRPNPPRNPPPNRLIRRAARYAWALLLVRIDGAFPLLCPHCGGELRVIAFITDAP
jgi:hypothetical protein